MNKVVLSIQVYTHCLKKIRKKKETNKNIMRMDDLLIVMMLDEHK